jgi:hypothetical protein
LNEKLRKLAKVIFGWKVFFLLLLPSTGFALKIEPFATRPEHSILLVKDSTTVRFTSDPSIQAGIKFGLGPLVFSYAQVIPNTRISGRGVSDSDEDNLNAKIYYQNFLLEYIYKKYRGFRSTENDGVACDFCFERINLTSREVTYNFKYAFNSDFRLKNVVSTANKKISGFDYTFLLTVFGNRWKISDPDNVFQGNLARDNPELDNIKEIRLNQGGPGLGFAFVAPFFENSFFALLISGNLGYQNNKLRIENRPEEKYEGFGASYNVKANLGTFGEGFNYGIRGFFVSNYYPIKGGRDLFSLNFDITVYWGYSF